MLHHIEEKDSFRIVGARTPLVEDAKENELRISAFWEKALHEGLVADLSRLNPSTPLNVLGVSVYHDPQNIFYYIASASDKPAPRGMVEFIIPKATWAICKSGGTYDDAKAMFRSFLMDFLPFSKYKYAELPDIEVYPCHNGQITRICSEAWFAIKTKGVIS